MSYQRNAPTESVDVDEVRKAIKHRPSESSTATDEVIFPSTIDDGLFFFVTATKSKREKRRAKAAPTEPYERD